MRCANIVSPDSVHLVGIWFCYLRFGHLAFSTYTRTFNKQSSQQPNPPLNRLLFQRHFLVYSLVQFQLFMGNEQGFLPFNIYSEFDSFISNNIDRFYVLFVGFWGDHCSLKPCDLPRQNENNACGRCMIVDGHMKIRRRICANPSASLVLPTHFDHIFDEIIVGCGHSPAVNSPLCLSCKDAGVKYTANKTRFTVKQKEHVRRRVKRKEDDVDINSMSEVSYSSMYEWAPRTV